MLQVRWGQGKKGDSAKRSLAKAVLWRVFAASNTLICGVFLARDLSVASKIAGSDTLFKTVSERAPNDIAGEEGGKDEYYDCARNCSSEAILFVWRPCL